MALVSLVSEWRGGKGCSEDGSCVCSLLWILVPLVRGCKSEECNGDGSGASGAREWRGGRSVTRRARGCVRGGEEECRVRGTDTDLG